MRNYYLGRLSPHPHLIEHYRLEHEAVCPDDKLGGFILGNLSAHCGHVALEFDTHALDRGQNSEGRLVLKVYVFREMRREYS